MDNIHKILLEPIITKALEEDWGFGDWTTDICIAKDTLSEAKIITREDIILAGADVAKAVFLKVDPSLDVNVQHSSGDKLKENQTILKVAGNARSILKAERVALNLLGRMSGISTLTDKYVNKIKSIKNTKTQLLDTRKTTPGLRIIEKSATVIGGARNHRMCLADGVIVKENHIRACGGIKKAVAKLLESLPPTLKIEVETTNLNEVKEAVECGADLVMLDNMSLEMMKEAVDLYGGRVLLEASGNVRLENIAKIATSGVDFISTSAIILAAQWSDLSLLFNES